MKILLCANTSWFLYNFCRNLLLTMQGNGHRVSVIAPPDAYSSKFKELGVDWYALPLHQTGKNPFQEFLAITRLFRQFRQFRPDIVYTFTIKCNIYVGLLTWFCPMPQVATLAGLGEGFARKNIFHAFLCLLYKLAFVHVRNVFFQNNDDLDLFRRQGIISPEQGERIPGLGVNLSRFHPVVPFGRKPKRIFLMFGRLLPQKGYDLFLQVAQRMKQSSASSVEFWILGIQDPSRTESASLFDRIIQAYDRGDITYLAAVEDVVPILQQADVVVLPSTYNEGVPACLLEAMACGKPLITNDWKGCRETVEHGVNGLLCEPGSVDALQQAVEYFLTIDDKRMECMGLASRQKAEREFDEQRVIAKYLDQLCQ